MIDEKLLLVISFILLFVIGVYVYEKETHKPKPKVIKEYWHINF
jgi:hypothetical protein